MATPICALAACNCSSAARMSGRCSISCDGRLTGRSVGRCRSASLNVWRGPSFGKMPASAASRSRCCASALRSGGSVALRLRQRRFLRRHVAAVGVARFELLAEDVEHLGVDRDELVGGLDLPAQRGFGDGGDHDVRAQRQIGRLDLKTLVVGLRLQRLNGAAVETPDVERVRHADLRGVERERVGARIEDRRERAGSPLVRRIEVGRAPAERTCPPARRPPACAARSVGHRRLQRGIVVQRALEQRVERRRSEQRPPFVRKCRRPTAKRCGWPVGASVDEVRGASGSLV